MTAVVRILATFLFTSVACMVCAAQSVQDTWTRYSLEDDGISQTFPKLPMKIERTDDCEQKASRAYYAYTKGAVYYITVTRKKKGNEDHCVNLREFGQASLDSYRNELIQKGSADNLKIGGRSVSRVVGKKTNWYLIDDLRNNRWIELAVTCDDEKVKNSQEWISHIRFGAKTVDKQVGDGASSMIGDQGVDVAIPPKHEVTKPAPDDLPLIIVAKPRARYTDAARENNTEGAVTLRVEFLASGSIGKIEVVRPLANGLTEQAITAARRMVFVPAFYHGTPFTTVRTVEISFSLY